jgi:hypothetical protein
MPYTSQTQTQAKVVGKVSNIRGTDSQGHKHKCGDTISSTDTDTDTGVGRVYQTYKV